MDKKKIILTGLQPTGPLHIGNYFGPGANYWTDYLKEYECYFFIADLHSLTENYNPSEKKSEIMGLAAEILAFGIDPEKCVFFRQSDIKEHPELNWFFNCITPIAFLERMTQYKDKAATQKQNINVGLFDYPVLQAADILMYDTDLVPVGADQLQHIELARDIAKFFNNRFGETFKIPEPKLTTTPKIMSLIDAEKKMSKSAGGKSCLFLADEPAEIKEKIKKAVATDKGLINLFGLGKIFIPNFDQNNYTGENLKLKLELADAIADYFKDFRETRKRWLANEPALIEILEKGADKARKIAALKMIEVREKVGIALS